AGGVMAAFVGMLIAFFPDIAGHLLAASVMSAPAALVFAKLMYPEREEPVTRGELKVHVETPDANAIDAAARGAGEGLQLAANVGAMLLAFIALIALINALLGVFGEWTRLNDLLIGAGWMAEGSRITLEWLLGVLLAPLAWLMGVPWADAFTVGSLLGVKTAVNEFVAYLQLSTLLSGGTDLSPRSIVIATYALCGFANFSSIAIQIGGIGGIAPHRRSDLARLGLRAMVAGSLAAVMTATIAGMLAGGRRAACERAGDPFHARRARCAARTTARDAGRCARAGLGAWRPGRRDRRCGSHPVLRCPRLRGTGCRGPSRDARCRSARGRALHRSPGALSPLRRTQPGGGRTADAGDARARRAHTAGDECSRPAEPQLLAGRSDAERRSHQPALAHPAVRAGSRGRGPVPGHGAAVRSRAAAAGRTRGDRARHPCASGRVRRHARPELRDAGRDPHDAVAGRRCRWHESRARSARGAGARHTDARHLAYHEHRGGHHAGTAVPPRSGGGGRSCT